MNPGVNSSSTQDHPHESSITFQSVRSQWLTFVINYNVKKKKKDVMQEDYWACSFYFDVTHNNAYIVRY